MSRLADLIAQKEALEKEIAETRQRERVDAIDKARALIAEYGLTSQDLFGGIGAKKSRPSTGKVAAKYRDPATGAEWTGRGRAPKWLEGRDRAKYLIKS